MLTTATGTGLSGLVTATASTPGAGPVFAIDAVANANIASTSGKLAMAFEPGANGTITLNGDLTSNGGNVQAFGPVIVGQRINAIDVTGAGGDGTLTFSSALTAAGTGSGLLFKAGSGSIEFDGQVGTSAARIDNIEIVSAQSTAFQADLYTGHLQQDAGGKQLLFLGNVDAETNQTEAANLTGTDIELNPNKPFFAYGDVTIDVGATGTLDLFGGSRIVVGNGTFTQNGTGVVYLGGQVVTSGGNINFDGAVQVMNDSVKVCSTGSSCATSFPSGGGNLGPAELELAFKPPNGVGLSLEAGGVTGGGFLYRRRRRHS